MTISSPDARASNDPATSFQPQPLGGILDLTRHSDPAALVDDQGRVLDANAAFLAQPGFCEESNLSSALQPALDCARDGTSRHTVSLSQGKSIQTFEITSLALPSETGALWLMQAVDRSMDISLRNALVDSRARFRDLLQISSDFAWETDAQGCFSMITLRGLAGYAASDLIGKSGESLLDPNAPLLTLLPFTTPAPIKDVEIWLRDAEGHTLCVEVSAVPLYDKGGNWKGARGVCRDVTQDRHYRTLMAEQRNRDRVFSRITHVFRREADPNDMLQAAASACTHGFAASGCMIFSTLPNLTGVAVRPQMKLASAFGHLGPTELAESVLTRLQALDAAAPSVQRLDGWSILAIQTIYGGKPVGAVLLWRDDDRQDWAEGDQRLLSTLAGQLAPAIEQRSQHHLLLDASRTDALTGLLNRRGFYDEMRRRFQRLQREQTAAALVYVDLDNFKMVNDVHGHAQGDEALRHVADILRNNTRSTDLVARLGGDEFAIWLDRADEPVALGRAQIFLTAGNQLIPYSGSPEKPLKLSIGIAVHHAKYREDINQLMTRADAAMYAVKRGGKGNYAMAAPPGDTASKS